MLHWREAGECWGGGSCKPTLHPTPTPPPPAACRPALHRPLVARPWPGSLGVGAGGAGLPRTVNKPRRGGRAGGGKLGRRGPDCPPACLALPCLACRGMQCNAMQCNAKQNAAAGPGRTEAGRALGVGGRPGRHLGAHRPTPRLHLLPALLRGVHCKLAGAVTGVARDGRPPGPPGHEPGSPAALHNQSLHLHINIPASSSSFLTSAWRAGPGVGGLSAPWRGRPSGAGGGPGRPPPAPGCECE